jgi:hypothetical protein
MANHKWKKIEGTTESTKQGKCEKCGTIRHWITEAGGYWKYFIIVKGNNDNSWYDILYKRPECGGKNIKNGQVTPSSESKNEKALQQACVIKCDGNEREPLLLDFVQYLNNVSKWVKISNEMVTDYIKWKSSNS